MLHVPLTHQPINPPCLHCIIPHIPNLTHPNKSFRHIITNLSEKSIKQQVLIRKPRSVFPRYKNSCFSLASSSPSPCSTPSAIPPRSQLVLLFSKRRGLNTTQNRLCNPIPQPSPLPSHSPHPHRSLRSRFIHKCSNISFSCPVLRRWGSHGLVSLYGESKGEG